MALQMNYNYPKIGIIFYNAYWRINPKNGLVGGKDEMNYILEVYKNVDDARAENIEPLEKFVYSFKPNLNKSAKNFIAQAYDHAKSTGIYSGSVDV